eukprot:TRINITY_DN66_c0_g1_i4.p3 TRINITY_DN66_c0_g1~~TRINITY_DN66_c0_g1_i4.p3  ORF type:complete len:113 (+),score=45.73 TRINITY_DN66_c0_g1_i4:119-457(+)
MLRSLVGSEMCIRDRVSTQSTGITFRDAMFAALRQTRRGYAAAAKNDAIKDLFLNEIKAVTARLNKAKSGEQAVTPAIMEAMQSEVATMKSRTGLSGVGDVGLSNKIKMTSL